MKDVTPKSNYEMIIQSIGYAVVAVLIIALLKIAFKAFMSVILYIIPVALVIFLSMKFGGKK